MTWLLVKKYLSKAGLWLKHHWYIPFSGIAILVSYIVFREKAESLMKALMENREGYKKQAKEVEAIHDKQISDRNKHLSEASEKIKEEHKKHEEKMEEIEKKKEDMVEELKKNDLASELDKEFDL